MLASTGADATDAELLGAVVGASGERLITHTMGVATSANTAVPTAPRTSGLGAVFWGFATAT
jgi:hypothetical protein